jgi:hypothetical protein
MDKNMNENLSDENGLVSAKPLAFKYGLIWAAINIVIFLLIYYGAPQLIGTWKQSTIQMIVGIGLAIYFTLEIRKQIGGFWTYREAISAIFVLFITPSIILYFFSLAFGKWIEPQYNNIISEATLNATTELMERISSDQDVIDKTIAETEQALEAQLNPSFFNIVKSLGYSVLIYFILSLIWAAIIKRDKPIFLTRSETEEI